MAAGGERWTIFSRASPRALVRALRPSGRFVTVRGVEDTSFYSPYKRWDGAQRPRYVFCFSWVCSLD